MATTKKIVIKQYNGEDYDTIYPQTLASQVKALSGSTDADAQTHIENDVRHITATERENWEQTRVDVWQCIRTSKIGVANGVAGLDRTGKVPSSQLPADYITAGSNITKTVGGDGKVTLSAAGGTIIIKDGVAVATIEIDVIAKAIMYAFESQEAEKARGYTKGGDIDKELKAIKARLTALEV